MTRWLPVAAAAVLATSGCGSGGGEKPALTRADCSRLAAVTTQMELFRQRMASVRGFITERPRDPVSARLELQRVTAAISALRANASHLSRPEIRDPVMAMAETQTAFVNAFKGVIAGILARRESVAFEHFHKMSELQPLYDRRQAAAAAAIDKVDVSPCEGQP